MSLLAAGCQGLIVSLRMKPTLPSRLFASLLPSLSLVFTWVYLALLAAAIALGHVMAMCARRVSIPSCANTALI